MTPLLCPVWWRAMSPSASTTTTARRLSASAIAVASPTIPPPTISTSSDSIALPFGSRLRRGPLPLGEPALRHGVGQVGGDQLQVQPSAVERRGVHLRPVAGADEDRSRAGRGPGFQVAHPVADHPRPR